MQSTSFIVPEMSCDTCFKKVDGALHRVQGVSAVNIDFKTKQVTVDYDPSNIKPELLVRTVKDLGFEVQL